jgi:hypothetical protein
MSRRRHYETDDAAFPADAYAVAGHRGVAWYVLGWETAPDEDTEWSGIEERTGRVVCRMVGDDCDFSFEPGELKPLEREAYCGVCGQVGCAHDGLDRSETEAQS